jgi:uncharacterized protein YegJ (DUF2314 family)
MKKFLLLAVLFYLASCNTSSTTKVTRAAEPDIYELPADDTDMNNAILSAKLTLQQFDSALLSNKYDSSTFALKVKFTTSTGAEHIWATSIMINDGSYYGTLDNLPNSTTEVRLHERIKINKDDISDWMYSDSGKLRGGYTIRAIRNKMPELERHKFDTEFPFKIEN